ncbi:MAG: prepilin-type N-terminal cleavage/methylation domain-containing protein [Deltaproteobacteria bacterium]|nr:prepilin-type N-terminal cleavage/methylation domain-containing protein [Deltaproteobacteria bacterium]
MGHLKHNLESQQGFSLMELILVMSLIGIMAFTAIPAITNTQSVSLDAASRKLESDIRYAQNLAMTTGDAYGFRTITDASDTNYEIYEVTSNTAVEDPYDHLDMQEDFTESFNGH